MRTITDIQIEIHSEYDRLNLVSDENEKGEILRRIVELLNERKQLEFGETHH